MSTTPPRATIVLERTYRADLAELWALWTTKAGFESWWGPEGFRVEVHVLEPEVGGRLHYDMVAAAPAQIAAMQSMGQPTSHPTHATFTEVAPPHRLAITHVVDFVPGVAPYDSTVVVELRPVGAEVHMVVTLHAMHDDQWTKMATMGWTSQLGKLDARYGV